MDNLTSVLIQKIFFVLTVKEISLLCCTNKKFKTVCKEESFWRTKVSNDYGPILKKYGDTWREIAINMDKVNMINLNNRWIDGRTYKEILIDTLQNGSSVVLNLQSKYLLPYLNSKEDLFDFQFNTHDQAAMKNMLDRDCTDEEVNNMFYIKTREMNVIFFAVYTFTGIKYQIYFPGDQLSNLRTGTALSSHEMIDPILYVMQFSAFSDDRSRELFPNYVSRRDF